jgi:uncharacterized protein YigE (DUF2233 family)
MRKFILLMAALFTACAVHAQAPQYTVVTVDPAKDRLELFLTDENGQPFNRLSRVAVWLRQRNRQLVFAMNAGMYHADYTPVGLFVADGVQRTPLNLERGKGNFFLQPNGVFLVGDSGARIVESSEYPSLAATTRIASQSGPMLVRHGLINPIFDPSSRSVHIRNGVGIVDGKVKFVISEDPVNFYEFASYFRDVLKCRDALYFDGAVSVLFAPAFDRNDHRTGIGPIIGVVRD